MQTIALINQKGGVGKTTTVANLAAALAAKGLRIAMIDLDPQSHLTMHFGLEPGASKPGVYELLTEEASFSEVAVEVQPNLAIAPACIDLAGAEIELVTTVGREQILADSLAAEELPYDYAMIDCPPSLGLLTLNALAATDEVIIPLQPHFLALQGLGKLLETVSLVQRRVNPRLTVGGIVLCMYESNTRLAGEVTEDVASFLAAQTDPNTPWAGARLYESRVRRNVKLAECPAFGESIFHYAPGCPGAADYDALAAEFMTVHGHDRPAEANVAEPAPPVVEIIETADPVATEMVAEPAPQIEAAPAVEPPAEPEPAPEAAAVAEPTPAPEPEPVDPLAFGPELEPMAAPSEPEPEAASDEPAPPAPTQDSPV